MMSHIMQTSYLTYTSLSRKLQPSSIGKTFNYEV
jgi:hypothetical protein